MELPVAADAEGEEGSVAAHGRPLGATVKSLNSLLQRRFGRGAALPSGPPKLPVQEHLNYIRKYGAEQLTRGLGSGNKTLKERGESILAARAKLKEFQPGGAGTEVYLLDWVKAAEAHFQ